MEYYYHLYSDGTESANFILTPDDLMAAFNRVGICAFLSGAVVLAFSIEDSHPHVLLFGTQDACLKFKQFYERLTIHYIVNSRGHKDNVRFYCELEPVTDEDYLLNVGVYTIIQPTKDGKKIMPYDYLWGTACLYFRPKPCVLPWMVGKDGTVLRPVRIGSLSARERKSLLASRQDVPDDWLVCNGFLLPTNYVDIKRFESIYSSHNRFRVFMGNSQKKNDAVSLSMAQFKGIQLEDVEARAICSDMAKKLFGRRDIRTLATDQRLELAMELRRRHRISFRQLAMLSRLPEEEIRKYVR